MARTSPVGRKLSRIRLVLASRARAGLGWALVPAIVVTVISASSVANAATAPTAQLSFSPGTISAGSKPDMTFMSQNVPSGSLLYLQESSDGGHHWRTVGKTTDTQGMARIAALSKGKYEFRITITDNGSKLAMSAPATLTVTGPGDVRPTPSGLHIPWLDIVVKPVWDAIIAVIVTWIISLF